MGNYLTTFVTSWYTPNPEVLARQQQIAEHIIVGAPVVHKLKEEAINEIEPTETPSYNIVIFGDSGVGKTTLVSYITGEPYQALSQYKIGQFITVNLEAPYNVQLKLWDIPNYCTGVKNLGTIFALRVHVCIGLFDCANDLSFYNLPNWIEKFKSSYFLEGDEYQPTTFIVATKLAKKRPNSDFTKMAVWASDHDYAYEEIDTVNQTNTDLLLETIVRAAINGGLDKVSRKSARAV